MIKGAPKRVNEEVYTSPESYNEQIELQVPFHVDSSPVTIETTKTPANPKDVDSGWSWLVVVASFTLQIFISGTASTHGIMLKELVDDLDESVFELSWISSISTGGMWAFSSIASIFIQKYGHRVTTLIGVLTAAGGCILSIFASEHYFLYVTMGLMPGIGFCFVNMTSLIIIYDYFYWKRPIALTIVNSGLSVGIFVFPYIVHYLIEEFGWRGCTLIVGGMFLNGLWCSLVFKRQMPASTEVLLERDKQDTLKAEHHQDGDQNNGSLWKDFFFYKCVASMFLTGICFMVFMTFLPLFCVERFGDESAGGTFLVSMVGIGSFIGRLVFGWIVYKQYRRATLVYAVSTAGCGLCYQLLVLCNRIPLMFVVASAQGFFNGGWVTMATLVLAQNFGIDRLSLTSGIVFTFGGIANIAGSPISAGITDLSGSIDTTYLVNGALFIASGLIVIPSGFRLVCAKNKKKESLPKSYMNVLAADFALFI